MKIYTNTRRVRIRYFIASTATFAGLMMLVSAPMAAIFTSDVISSILPLVLGVLLSTTGLKLTNRWTRLPNPEETLNKALKGFGKEAALLHLWLPADHVLICKHGVFSLTVLHQRLQVSINGNEWKNTTGPLLRLWHSISQDAPRDPGPKAIEEAQRTQAWFDEHFPESSTTVQPIIVPTHPKTELYISEPSPIPITHLHKGKYSLKEYVRQQSAPTLSEADIIQLTEILNITPATKKET
jgi:hypothetical protein